MAINQDDLIKINTKDANTFPDAGVRTVFFKIVDDIIHEIIIHDPMGGYNNRISNCTHWCYEKKLNNSSNG